MDDAGRFSVVYQESFKTIERAVFVKKRIIVLVSNDLTFDRRVEKTCDLWTNKGWQLSLVGVLKEHSIKLDRCYRTERLRTFFEKGAGFYVVLQVKLFFYLMFHSADVIWANDLDTLLPARIVGKLKGIPVIYDSHESVSYTHLTLPTKRIV